jgi:hypothetical protein
MSSKKHHPNQLSRHFFNIPSNLSLIPNFHKVKGKVTIARRGTFFNNQHSSTEVNLFVTFVSAKDAVLKTGHVLRIQ